MRVELEGVAKRFDREWIIQDFSYTFKTGLCYGIEGRNGAGKSTLLRMIAGHLSPSRGRITFWLQDKKIASSEVYPHLSYVAPYIDVIEELSLVEALKFHFQFKPILPGFTVGELPQVLGLRFQQQRRINTYSSGMKQRVVLGLALFSNTPLLLLDEPTTTLDKEGQAWFQEQLTACKKNRLVVIATNVKEDLQQCETIISVGKNEVHGH
ncbi:MAG: ABC transporter ATP-binding protein [Bacteroidota bacterium]